MSVRAARVTGGVITGAIVIVVALWVCGNTSWAAGEPICLSCHETAAVPEAFRNIPAVWRQSWHGRHGVACNNCHGGDSEDAAMAMSPARGFKGVPGYIEVPEFCGTCHVGVLKNYLDSKHGRALKKDGRGPNCVTCHGSHEVQKASIEIINEKRCTQCHGFERAATIKEALSSVEETMDGLRIRLGTLKKKGVYTEESDKTLFATEAAFRIVFHTVDVNTVRAETDDAAAKLATLEKSIGATESELGFRTMFAGTVMVLFLTLAGILFGISRSANH